jgi:hypothetical protein
MLIKHRILGLNIKGFGCTCGLFKCYYGIQGTLKVDGLRFKVQSLRFKVYNLM